MQSGLQKHQLQLPKFKDIESIKSLNSLLDQDLTKRFGLLHAALDAAFKDANQGHPSQLIYAAIFQEVLVILDDIKNDVISTRARSEEKPESQIIRERFATILADLPVLVGRYFEANFSRLKENKELLAALKIDDIDSYRFDWEKFAKFISADKITLLPEVVNAYEALALQKIILRRDVCARAIARVRGATHASAEEYRRTIEMAKTRLRNDYSEAIGIMRTERKLKLDMLKSAALNREQLKVELNEKLQSVFAAVTKSIEVKQDDFAKTVALYKQNEDILLRQSERYKKQYEALKQFIEESEPENHDQQVEAERRLKALDEDYKDLSRKLEQYKTHPKINHAVIKSIRSEMALVDTRPVPPVKFNFEAISAVQAIDAHLQALDLDLFGFVENKKEFVAEIVPMSGLVLRADNYFKEYRKSLLVELSGIDKEIESADQELLAQLAAQMRATADLIKGLQSLCVKQVSVGNTPGLKQLFGNPLWTTDAVNAIETALKKSPLQTLILSNDGELSPEGKRSESSVVAEHDETSQEMRVRLRTVEVNSLKREFTQQLDQYAKGHQGVLIELANEVKQAHVLLELYRAECLKILESVQQELYIAGVANAKLQYKKKLEGLINQISKVGTRIQDTALPQPFLLESMLRENRNLKKQKEKQREELLQAEKKRQDKEEKARLLEARKTDRETKEKKDKIIKECGGELINVKIKIDRIAGRLHDFFQSSPTSELHAEYTKLLGEYHQAFDVANIDCCPAYLRAFEQLEQRVIRQSVASQQREPSISEERPFEHHAGSGGNGSRPPAADRPEKGDRDGNPGIRMQAVRKKPGFWKMYRARIIGSTLVGAGVGAIVGGGLGVGMGVIGSIPTGGLSILATPVAIAILAGAGAVVGGALGLVVGLVSSAISYYCCGGNRQLEYVTPLLDESDESHHAHTFGPGPKPGKMPTPVAPSSGNVVPFASKRSSRDMHGFVGSNKVSPVDQQEGDHSLEQFAAFEKALAKELITYNYLQNRLSQNLIKQMHARIDSGQFPASMIINKNQEKSEVIKELACALLEGQFKHINPQTFKGTYLEPYVLNQQKHVYGSC